VVRSLKESVGGKCDVNILHTWHLGGVRMLSSKNYARQVRAPELQDGRQYRREGDRGVEWRQAISRQEGGEGDRGVEWRQAFSRQGGGKGDRGVEWRQAFGRQEGGEGDSGVEWRQAFGRQEGGEGDSGGGWRQIFSQARWKRGRQRWCGGRRSAVRREARATEVLSGGKRPARQDGSEVIRGGEWMERCRYGGRMPSQRSVAR